MVAGSLRLLCILAVATLAGAGCSSTPESTGSEDTGNDGRPGRDIGGDDDEDTGGGEDDTTDDVDSAVDTVDDVTPGEDTAAPDTTPTPDTTPEPDTTPTPDSGPIDTGAPDVLDDGCSEKLRYIYVIDKDKRMHSFDPYTGEFTLVGEVDCGEFSDTTPSSMAMSRLGVALVNYSNNSLQTVNIDDAGCTESGWTPGTGGFNRFGMGYVADTIGGEETLYVSSRDTLATIDTDTWRLTTLGPLPSQSELSGTGDGELWGFFPLESPPALIQLDRSNGAEIQRFDLPPLPDNLDTFAFTAWNGEFYLFYRLSGLGETTAVYRFNETTERLDVVVEEAGINVVGAGVSICAPTGD